jgi:hypothetical protein
MESIGRVFQMRALISVVLFNELDQNQAWFKSEL